MTQPRNPTTCAQPQAFFLALDGIQRSMLLEEAQGTWTCRRCRAPVASHPLNGPATTAIVTTPHPAPPTAAAAPARAATTSQPAEQADTTVATSSAIAATPDAGPTMQGMFLRAFWKGGDVVQVSFENPLTRGLYETLAAKASATGASRDWAVIFRKTVAPSTVELTQRIEATFNTAMHATRYTIRETGPMPLEETVDFLADLGVALLERHLHVIREEVVHRQLHREFMVPSAVPVTAREHLLLRVIGAERAVGLTATSLPLKLPSSWDVPAWWGATWLLIAPQLRIRYWEDIARVVIGGGLQAMTKSAMGTYIKRSEWEQRYYRPRWTAEAAPRTNGLMIPHHQEPPFRTGNNGGRNPRSEFQWRGTDAATNATKATPSSAQLYNAGMAAAAASGGRRGSRYGGRGGRRGRGGGGRATATSGTTGRGPTADGTSDARAYAV